MTAHRFTLSLFAGLCLSTSVSAQAPAGHNHGAEMPGLKKEMFAGITAEDLLKMSDKPKTVKVVLVATFNAAN
jgi:hypothetical protein